MLKAKMILELITIASASVNISVGCLIFFIFFKLKYIFQNIKMNAEDLLKIFHWILQMNNMICNKNQKERGFQPL